MVPEEVGDQLFALSVVVSPGQARTNGVTKRYVLEEVGIEPPRPTWPELLWLVLLEE